MLAAWIYVITALIASNSWSLNKLYPTAAARADLAGSGGRNPALLFLYGRLAGDSLGAVSAWRYGVWAAIAAALMSVFLVVRHTRADEEAGRGELVGSAAVGRLAPLTAALGVAVAANAVLTVLLLAALLFLGLPAAGSAVFALVITTCGLAFAAVAAVTAQLAAGRPRGPRRRDRRARRGVPAPGRGRRGRGRRPGLADLAVPARLDRVRPALHRGPVVGAGPAAGADRGGRRGRVRPGRAPRPRGRPAAGPARAGRRVRRAAAPAVLFGQALGLAWRLQRGTLCGWAAGFAFTFAASGAAAKGIGSLLGGSAQLRTAFTRLGGQAGITDAYLAALMSLAGLAAAAYATSAVLRLRAEESAERAEPLLATAAGRIRWGLSHVAVAVAGSALLLAVAGVAAGLGYGLRTGSAGTELARLLGAALVQLPASLTVAGAAVALFGLVPRACVAGAWSVLGAVVVIALFGQILRLSGWVTGISPFSHVPKLPGAAVTLRTTGAPLLWLALAALALAVAGLAGLRRRDIG